MSDEIPNSNQTAAPVVQGGVMPHLRFTLLSPDLAAEGKYWHCRTRKKLGLDVPFEEAPFLLWPHMGLTFADACAIEEAILKITEPGEYPVISGSLIVKVYQA